MNVLSTLILNSPRAAPWALGVMLAAAALAAWLYAPQVRALQRPWRWMLPALRVAGLAALAICIVQPVVRRTQAAAENGAVVILVDRSRSMSVRDWRALPALARGNSEQADAAAAELVDVADCLGMIPPAVRDESFAARLTGLKRLSELARDLLQARTELDFARLSGTGIDAAQSRVTSLAAQVHDLAGALQEEGVKGLNPLISPPAGKAERSSRIINAALRATQAAQQQADRTLYLSNPQVAAACDEVAGESRFQVIERALVGPAGLAGKFAADVPLFGFGVGEGLQPLPLRGNGQSVARLGIVPDANKSDLTGSLQAALGRLQSQPVDAVIYFTDGRQIGESGNMGTPTVPVFPVIVPTPGSNWASDVAIANVTVPQSAFVGETIDVRGQVGETGIGGGGTIHVDLEVDGRIAARKDVSVDGNEAAWVDFPLKMDVAGIRRIALEAAPLPDEATVDNNRVERAVKVIKGGVHVAIISGSAGWDYQYVRNCLKRTPWVNVDDEIVSDDSPLKLSADQIMGEDVVMLFDVPVGALSEDQWNAINRLVRERGNGVIFAGGDAEVLSDYPRQAALADLWPFTIDQRPIWRMAAANDAGFHLAPGPDASNQQVLDISSGDLAQQWAGLPAFYRYLPLAKTAASQTLLQEPESGDAVLTAARVGRGRVVVFGADETWRWRAKIGDQDQDRFWLQLIRFAMQEPYSAIGDGVALDADPVLATPDDSIALRGKFDSAPMPSSADVQILQGQKVMRSVQLSPDSSGNAAAFIGSTGRLAAGNYLLRLTSPGGGKNAELAIDVADSDEAEMADISPSAQPLSAIADASGGAVIPLNELSTVPARIAQARAGQVRVTDQAIWDSPWLFLFVLACFAVEWAMRKRLGLA
ncbi:MAG TPA: hypothetical protein VMD30_04305 [Tepidisphaeraceae bacterium]|nr:hypothetical protein [Tepidisphaeraceae bacterium]